MKNIHTINFGSHSFPPAYALERRSHDGSYNICSRCLSGFYNRNSLILHSENCQYSFKTFHTSTFDSEIRHKSIEYAKINTLRNKQTLSLLGNCFIKHKTVYSEVEPYDFYVCIDSETKEIMGYFSKHKELNNSLSCIVILPPFQKEGLGTLLIDLSQQPALCPWESGTEEESAIPNKLHVPLGPERPLSEGATEVYKKYWKYKVTGAKSVVHIAKKRNIGIEDAIIGLEQNGFDFRAWKMDYNKIETTVSNEEGKRSLLVKRPRREIREMLISNRSKK